MRFLRNELLPQIEPIMRAVLHAKLSFLAMPVLSLFSSFVSPASAAAGGWLPTDCNSSHAFLKEFWAFLNFSNYSTMPISRQLLERLQ